MIFGSIYLLISYGKYQENEAARDGDRPTYMHAIRENISFITDGGKIRQIADLEGRVWIAVVLTKELQPDSKPTVASLRWLAEKFKDEPEKAPTVVAFVLDVDADQPQELAKVLPDFSEDIELWRVAAGEGKTPVQEFIKNGFRFGEVPQLEDGKWEYDSNLMLLDQQAKVRGTPSGKMSYDFYQVAAMEAAYAQAGKDHPGEKRNPLPMTTEKFRTILLTSVRYLNEHPPDDPEK